MRSRRFGLALVCLGLVLAAAPAKANLAVNGSFESPALPFRSFCITFFTPACPAVPAWSGNFYLVNDDSGGGIGGVPTPPIPDGGQYIMLQMTGSATQSITVAQPGVYTLSWFDAGRTFFSNTETYNVVFGGTLLGSFSTTITSPWTSHSLSFTTGTGTFALSFVGTNVFGGDNSSFIDNVVLDPPQTTAATPEPSTLTFATAALCTLMRRRRLEMAQNSH
jgi:hypothetical protein